MDAAPGELAALCWLSEMRDARAADPNCRRRARLAIISARGSR